MRTACLINHFNYGQFVAEACSGALGQTTPFDEIILVDDGSTDGSLDVVRETCARHERVRLIEKQNEGQLSCMNLGFAASTADVVFFLDADDVYEERCVERVLEVYDAHPRVDFVFTSRCRFGRVESDGTDGNGDRDLGYSVIAALAGRRWIGAPTSCLSMRRHVAERVLPIPYLEDWRTRADDCLIFGASVVGARKYHLNQPLVRYRTHDDNLHDASEYDRDRDYLRKLAINRLLKLLASRCGYDSARLAEFAHREFRTIERPTFRQWREYTAIGLRSDASLSRRLGIVASIAAHQVLGR